MPFYDFFDFFDNMYVAKKKIPKIIKIIKYLHFEGAWQHEDKVLLKQVDVLTLHHGRMTTGRRSSPVPQVWEIKLMYSML